MALLISDLIPQFRREIDPQISRSEEYTTDGNQYVFNTEYKPIVTSTTSVFLNHIVNTTGVDQFVPSGLAGAAAGFYYDENLNRGQVLLYSGIYPTGVGFFPWNGTTVKLFYDSTNYTPDVLAGYLVDGIPQVEAVLNLGYEIVDVSPSGAGTEDQMDYYNIGGFTANAIGITPEPLFLVQTLIIKEAALKLTNRERRLRVKNNEGITIRDGDIEINASNTYRTAEAVAKDLRDELKTMYAEIKMNMDLGIGIAQLNEMYLDRVLIDYNDPDYFRNYSNQQAGYGAMPQW